MNPIVLIIGLGLSFVLFVVALLFFISWLSWNIPVVVLRFQGDKRRPQVRITKGRKSVRGGVSRLFVRGYHIPLTDFDADKYYPAHKGKNGALILFEVKPGLLTPVIPRKIENTLAKKDPERLRELREHLAQFQDAATVDFLFDQELYDKLILEAVEDVDIDFMMQEYSRTDSQYVTGWRDFLNKYGSHLVLLVIAMCLLVGFIMWLDKAPEMMATCSSAAQEQATNVLREFSKNVVTPPG